MNSSMPSACSVYAKQGSEKEREAKEKRSEGEAKKAKGKESKQKGSNCFTTFPSCSAIDEEQKVTEKIFCF